MVTSFMDDPQSPCPQYKRIFFSNQCIASIIIDNCFNLYASIFNRMHKKVWNVSTNAFFCFWQPHLLNYFKLPEKCFISCWKKGDCSRPRTIFVSNIFVHELSIQYIFSICFDVFNLQFPVMYYVFRKVLIDPNCVFY